MNFYKINNDYIDLNKVISVSFNDKDREIHFFVLGFNDYKLTSKFDDFNLYLFEKRCLIRKLISLSVLDCEDSIC